MRRSVLLEPEEIKRRWIADRRAEIQRVLGLRPDQAGAYANPEMRRAYNEELSDLAVADLRLDEGSYGRCAHCDGWVDHEMLSRLAPGHLYCSAECRHQAAVLAQHLDEVHPRLEHPATPSARVLGELAEVARAEPGQWPLCFSCNPQLRVWPAEFHRFTRPEGRRHSEHPFLKELARLVVRHRWPGGQFLVYRDRVEDPAGHVIWRWQ